MCAAVVVAFSCYVVTVYFGAIAGQCLGAEYRLAMFPEF